MNNLDYRKSRGTDKPVDLSHAKEEWLKIKDEREKSNYLNCITSESSIEYSKVQIGSETPLKQFSDLPIKTIGSSIGGLRQYIQ